MSEPSRTPLPGRQAGRRSLEQRYRRLLAWYPQPFRSQHEEEMLAVLLASGRPGQLRPGLADSADVIRSALGMRARRQPAVRGPQDLADALALFSLLAPLILLSASVLEVALPYKFSLAEPPAGSPIAQGLGGASGLGLITHGGLAARGFDVALGGQLVIAVLVVAGCRRLALGAVAAAAGYWIFSAYWIPEPLQVLSTSIFILEAAALAGSPGPRRGRQLLTWRHGVVLVLAVAAVQASTFAFYRTNLDLRVGAIEAAARPYVITAAALGAAAVLAALLLRLNWYLGLLLAAAVYPWARQLDFSLASLGAFLGLATPGHLAALYLPPLLLASGAMLARIPRRGGSIASRPSGPDQPRPV
jgi:hypothetical protein